KYLCYIIIKHCPKNGKLTSVVVSIASVDVVPIVESVLELHTELLNRKQIKVIKKISDITFVSTDTNMLHTIIRNLLSNAIKYSYEQSSITISISKHDIRYTAITISDTGMGMSEDRLQEIFSVKKHSYMGTANEQGTGLGLVIVKEFVSLLQGAITVTSKEGEGTTCSILIPSATEQTMQAYEETFPTIRMQTKHNSASTDDTKKYVQHKHILIVDDDDAMRLSLRLLLEEYATIHEASSGDEAYMLLLETHPDLVISDIQMMHGGGIELCEKIKENASVSHIPIILLTAFGTETDMIEGLKAGADEYLSKPFNKEILLLKIQYVFKLREELHRMFRIQEIVEVQSGTINSLDEKIIQKIITYIHEHIADPNLSVEQLSDFVGASRSTLHRKMNALTNMTPNDFIRMIRLKKAAELLKTGKFSISEVAYDTGFNDPRYFSKCFKEFFGKTPSEFTKE
ncbi:MAG TPA: response regulator, partial [Bacteroidales bacterium]|nr:response regulator [Bacteroidales bacterium]